MSIFERLGIPGPKPNIIFGSAIDIVREGTHVVFQKWTEKYGPIVGFYIGGLPQVLITDLDLIRQVMIKDFQLFSSRHQLIPGGVHPLPQMQEAITWARGKVWKQKRMTLSPSFTTSKLNAMEELMISSVKKLLCELDEKAKCGREFNIKPLLEESTFSASAKCILGHNLSLSSATIESQSFINATRPKLQNSILAIAMVLFPSLTFIAHPLRVLWEKVRFHMLWSDEGRCHNVLREIIRMRKDNKLVPNDLLQLLINNEKNRLTDDVVNDNSSLSNMGLSEEEIISNVHIFLLAAFETTSVTLQFAINLLINHQDVQEKLRNELQYAVEHSGGELSLKTISKVALLNHVIMETLRMYPPLLTATTRVAEEDYEYQGFRIPKGTGVFVGITSIHNDPKLWPEPEKYKPERFGIKFDKIAFLPFGTG